MPDPTDEPDYEAATERANRLSNMPDLEVHAPSKNLARAYLASRAEVVELQKDVSVARQSLYKVVEQRNKLHAEVAKLREGFATAANALDEVLSRASVRNGIHTISIDSNDYDHYIEDLVYARHQARPLALADTEGGL